jgi:hypothetical protein
MPCIVTKRGEPAPRGARAWLGALRAAAIALVALPTSGCYLMQAASGQLDVARRSRPIEEVVREEKTPQSLRERLALVVAAREFAVRELALPDGRSYREYAPLDRPYALWNVVATREFSARAAEIMFPDHRLRRAPKRLFGSRRRRRGTQAAHRGYDVSVGGARTYFRPGHCAIARSAFDSSSRCGPNLRLVNTIFTRWLTKSSASGDTSQRGVRDSRGRRGSVDLSPAAATVRMSSSAPRDFCCSAAGVLELLVTRIRLAAYARDLDEADTRIEKIRAVPPPQVR